MGKIYVLRDDQLISRLEKLGWYFDKKTKKLDNGTFDPSPYGKYVAF
jgi:hypothetical protein